MNKTEEIVEMLKKNNGTITTQEVIKQGIHREYIRQLIAKGTIMRSSRGVYILPDNFEDEFLNLQARFKRGIFSNTAALFLLGLTDRTPVKFDMTFPQNYNTTNVILDNVRVFHVKTDLIEIGKIIIATPFGNAVNIYCMERTLCDILIKKNNIEIDIIAEAFKRYVKNSKKNIPLLSDYAKRFAVEDKVRSYLEVLL